MKARKRSRWNSYHQKLIKRSVLKKKDRKHILNFQKEPKKMIALKIAFNYQTGSKNAKVV